MPNFDINQRAVGIRLQAPTTPTQDSFIMIEGLRKVVIEGLKYLRLHDFKPWS